MTNNNQCDHIEAIAKDFYKIIVDENVRLGNPGWKPWGELNEPQRESFRTLAKKALPTIGNHALNDVKDYLGYKVATESGIKKVLLWLAAAVVGGLATLGLAGCGHDVVVTPDATVITKDGAAVVMRKGFFSFSQGAPNPTPVPVPPVIVQKGK